MRPGDVVADRFKILHAEASGGMGVVHRARDLSTGADVALKVLRRDRGLSRDRFAQEIALLSTLDHPHIVGYVAHGTTPEGVQFLVMPWLEGHHLERRLLAGPLTTAETMELADRVAGALAYLHERGLVHRDLKPTNLFLSNGRLEEVKVIDLGIAHTVTELLPVATPGVLMGTPGFIAPEQALEGGELAPAVDIFAFGCVLFECLTGQRLFQGSNAMAILAKVLVEEAPGLRELRPDVPEAIDRLIGRMVSKDPARRPPDGAALLASLADLQHAPLSRRPPSLTASEQRVVSVLVVVLPESPGTAHNPEETQPEEGPLTGGTTPFGVRVLSLGGRSAIALAPEGLSAIDQASVLARYGRHVAETYVDASVALATGNAATAHRLPVGDAIDRGVTLVRSAAPGSGLHVDEVSAALLASRFDLRPSGDSVVVVEERLSLDPTRTLLGRPTSCVGRERELTLLEATFARCQSKSEPRAVLVTAPAGIGKSRLRHEFIRRLRTRSPAPLILQCRGDPLQTATPYALLSQAVRAGMGLGDREPFSQLGTKIRTHVGERIATGERSRVAAFLGELLGAPVHGDDAPIFLRAARRSTEAMSDQVRRAFEDLLVAWTTEQPLVLVLEDLHWSDPASVRLLDGALGRLRNRSLFVLAIARPEVRDRFGDLWKKHSAEVRLQPLPPRACETLVREVMGSATSSEDVHRIVEQSEGNAFYLEELIREAAGPRSRRSPRAEGDALPETVLAMAQARLERLEPPARKVLRAASVFGAWFSIDGVAALLGEPAHELESTMTKLIEEEAIATAESSVRTFVFRHSLLRAAVYATLTQSDRELGHGLAAAWLESNREDPEIVAMHWLAGADEVRASAGFARAGKERLDRAQADAAARCATRALLVGDPSTQRADTILPRMQLLAAALEATRRVDSSDILAGIESRMRLPVGWEPGPRSTPVHLAVDRAITALRSPHQPPALTDVLVRSAGALAALSDFARAKEYLEEALAAAVDDPARLRSAQYVSAKIAFWLCDFQGAVEILSNSILPADARERLEMLLILATAMVAADGREALARSLDCVGRAETLLETELGEDPVSEVHCAKGRILCFGFAGHYAMAADAAERATVLAQRAGLRYEECAHLHNTGEALLHMGELARAKEALDASRRLAAEIGAEILYLHNELRLAYIAEDVRSLEDFAARFRGDGWPMHEFSARFWLGRLLGQGRPGPARRELQAALDLAKSLQVRIFANECETALEALSAES